MYFEQAGEQAEERPNAQPNAQAHEHIIKQNNKLNKTKLKEFYNYISKNNAKIFEKIRKSEKDGIVQILKQVDIYIENQKILDYMSEEQILDTQIQYWSVKELYESPYKIFLKNLTSEQFKFRYLQAKKYTKVNENSYCDDGIIRYFIKLLQQDLKGESTNG